ncbi:MAG: hypothetical protein IJ125_06825 [Atopobiaceae bacterium]|nr:hypothetical protein [Atopobiaceae bacterium]
MDNASSNTHNPYETNNSTRSENAPDAFQQHNEGYLREFEKDLVASGMPEKATKRHLENIDFYINTYLVREGAASIEEGCLRVGDFLGDYFIRECMWSTPTTIKQNASSFKRFYKYMVERGHVSQTSYDALLASIENGLSRWLEDCEEFNTPEGYGPEDSDSDLYNMTYELVARNLGFGSFVEKREPLNASDESEAESEVADDLPSRQDVIDDFTFLLFYLSAHDENGSLKAPVSVNLAAIRNLQDMGLLSVDEIGQQVVLSEEGRAAAQDLLEALEIGHLA